jgi:hypothetical protein
MAEDGGSGMWGDEFWRSMQLPVRFHGALYYGTNDHQVNDNI